MRHHITLVIFGLALLCGAGHLFAGPCEVLQRIEERAIGSSSDVVLVVYQGRVIGCYGGKKAYTPVDTRSVTKTFVSLATGIFLQEKCCSVDAPVYTYFPEWNQGLKKDITLRQLLNHTSGLQSDEEIYYSVPNVVQMALASDFYSYPNCSFKYNNKATNLLAGLIQRATGCSIHEYLRGRLFFPLGINSETWLCDPCGNNFGMSHLSINAMDLAKIGMLIAQNGVCNCVQYLSPEWVDFMKTPSQLFTPFYGALTWLGYSSLDMYWDQSLLDMYRACGVPEEYVEPLELLQGRVLHFAGYVSYGNFRMLAACQLEPLFGSAKAVYEFFNCIENIGLPLARWDRGQVSSVAARGYGGQLLIVFPESNLIGVRLSSTCSSQEYPDNFADFEILLNELAYQMTLMQ